MKRLLLIGMGPGDPRQVTFEAVEAMRSASVFFVHDKGARTADLRQARIALLHRYLEPDRYRVVMLQDPRRDVREADYQGAVGDWHRQRACLYAKALEDELATDAVGAFLVWGDPGLYDSTLRILEHIVRQGGAYEVEVIPGISSVQALAARHQVPLTRLGQPLTILPGRQLAQYPSAHDRVVMLDGNCAFAGLDEPGVFIYWGAYLGSADEVLIAGPLSEVRERILETRDRLRQEKGWIMDVYLLRRP
ncbi:precorrin-6A synthase (deacetylating) [Pseudomonas entomophila]|uniref:precorrin-6A synthase (deacetylating) n=1 Tax=Pseudomonas entomophila TaxID=312306 RepID=UPI0015E43E4C|nr:precorrin-6A synthase (deacetylating) [Pseudomonas entomophila]MBA1189230.1 precorrin-6A synthase (deacetylating) [Pseudomonas entomophila]